MVRNRLSGLFLALAASGLAVAHEPAIDSQAGAARAIFTAVRLGDEAPANYAILTYAPRDFVERALRLLRASYTPAALKAIPGGVDIACPVSGSFHARYALKVLDFDMSGCVMDIYGQAHELTGPAQVKLKTESFTPTTVAAFSVGDAAADFIEDLRISGQDEVQNHIVRNLRMAGSIVLGRPTVDDNFEGAFSHTLCGFYRDDYLVHWGMPGNPVGHSEFAVTAGEGGYASGNYSYGDTGWKEDVTLSGDFRQDYVNAQPYDAPPEVFASVITGAVTLRSLNTGDYNTGTERFQISGSAHYSWPATADLSCADGRYGYSTPVALRHPDEMSGGSEAWNAGQLVANGTAAFSFRANSASSGLPDMHVTLNITGVGVFNYDGNSLQDTPLVAAAQCN